MNEPKGPGWWSIVLSTIAAAFGVQSKRNLEKDFNSSSILPYVIAGVLFTACFVGIVMLVVLLVVPKA
jgi:hypothetical protein